MNSGIYNIRNLTNNNIYIGSAIDFNDRWYLHKKELKLNKHHSIYLQRAYNKYGENNFIYEVMECVNVHLNESKLEYKKRLVEEKEQRWIDFFNPEYNMCKVAGSKLGAKCSDETRLKISNSTKGKKKAPFSEQHKLNMSIANIGKSRHPHSEETKSKISATSKLRFFSEETRKKMSIAKIGKFVSEETRKRMSLAQKGMLGKFHTEETKLKMSADRKGVPNPRKQRGECVKKFVDGCTLEQVAELTAKSK